MIDLQEGPYYNWNRMAMLQHAGARSDEHSVEIDEVQTRVNLQNQYAGTKDSEIEEVLELIQITITPDIKKAVDKYIKKYTKKSKE